MQVRLTPRTFESSLISRGIMFFALIKVRHER
jgi:hypothetical protein